MNQIWGTLDNDVVPGTFLSRFTLLEDALLNSVKIVITPANSNADGNGARELILSTKFFLLGSYEINIVANDFDAMLSANDIIAPVPSFDLLDGQDYTFRLQYQDRGGNPSAGVEATMIRFDVTRPRFTAAELNLSTGTLIVTATEILNLDENDRGTYYSVNQTVNLGQFFIGNESATSDLLSLGDGSFVETDGTAITITMEENDRISAIEQSATPGGMILP